MRLLRASSCGLALLGLVGWWSAPAVVAVEPAQSQPKTTVADNPASTAAANPRRANRLARESSPYLLAHAYNPVDWHPWGDEALEKARRERKLIFLSIGYSSCYWCHVMERESFMDDSLATQLNENYVAIKVDREERPDIDDVYMHALQVYLQLSGAGGSGGWPMTMILTPDAKPLFGATYLPLADRDDRLGLKSILTKITEAWSDDPEKWQASSDQLATIVRDSMRRSFRALEIELTPRLADNVVAGMAGIYDARFGGFGFDEARPMRPKFPEPPQLLFLLDRAARRRDDAAREMAVHTLVQMASGGIRDHIGGGYHRYSTDRYWRVPHFEKMLYDQGQLLSVYARAFSLTRQPLFRQVSDEIVAFVERELHDPDGGFYSSLDAETAGEEGRCYVWSRVELQSLLEASEFELFASIYGVLGEPNFEGRHIPLLNSKSAVAADAPRAATETQQKLASIRAKLLAARNLRERPATDRKILASWNGLMIRGLVDAAVAFDEPRYREAAARSARFVLANLRDAEGQLLHSYAGGAAKIPGFLDDYAFFVDGLLALHEATDDRQWLDHATRLTDMQIDLFSDSEQDGFYFTSRAHDELFARGKQFADGVMPSANTVAAGNLMRLGKRLDNACYLELAEKLLARIAARFDDAPAFAPQAAALIEEFLSLDSDARAAGNGESTPVPAADDDSSATGEH